MCKQCDEHFKKIREETPMPKIELVSKAKLPDLGKIPEILATLRELNKDVKDTQVNYAIEKRLKKVEELYNKELKKNEILTETPRTQT